MKRERERKEEEEEEEQGMLRNLPKIPRRAEADSGSNESHIASLRHFKRQSIALNPHEYQICYPSYIIERSELQIS
tara:strand:+ start:1050 stop:1277 length:228 start_codon:yes stop_codon:yes gene_type:complete